MALVVRSADADYDATQALTGPQISGLIAGEDIPRGAPCRIDGTSGKVFKASGAGNNASAIVAGFAARRARTNQPLTLLTVGNRFHYSDGNLTPGTYLYLSTTAGEVDTATTAGGLTPILLAVNTTDVVVK